MWSHHAAVGRLSGLMALSLADASVLHYNTVLASQSLRQEVEKLSRDSNQFRNISKGKDILKFCFAVAGRAEIKERRGTIHLFLLLFVEILISSILLNKTFSI